VPLVFFVPLRMTTAWKHQAYIEYHASVGRCTCNKLMFYWDRNFLTPLALCTPIDVRTGSFDLSLCIFPNDISTFAKKIQTRGPAFLYTIKKGEDLSEMHVPYFKARSQNCEKHLLVSSCLSVRPSVRMEQLGSQWWIFIKFEIIFRKSVVKTQVLLKSDKNNGQFTCISTYIFSGVPRNSFRGGEEFNQWRTEGGFGGSTPSPRNS
jgi:hypothetical protein